MARKVNKKTFRYGWEFRAGTGTFLYTTLARAKEEARRTGRRYRFKDLPQFHRLDMDTGERVELGSNPAEQDSATDLYETWAGRPATKQKTVVADAHREREHLAHLGKLIELEILIDENRVQPLDFSADDVELGAAKNQLFLVGGNQKLDLAMLREQFGLEDDELAKDLVDIGPVASISYHAAKHTDNFKPTDYIHEIDLAKDVPPRLIYDRLNEELLLAGGSYTIRPEGLVR